MVGCVARVPYKRWCGLRGDWRINYDRGPLAEECAYDAGVATANGAVVVAAVVVVVVGASLAGVVVAGGVTGIAIVPSCASRSYPTFLPFFFFFFDTMGSNMEQAAKESW